MRNRLNRGDGERGASAVEFALIAALLLMIVFGIIQFGIAYNRQQSLESAAREGARVASIDGTQSAITTRVGQAVSLINSADITISYSYSTDNGSTYTAIANNSTDKPCTDAGTGQLIKVTTSVTGNPSNYWITIPLVGTFHLTYSASGVFRCESS